MVGQNHQSLFNLFASSGVDSTNRWIDDQPNNYGQLTQVTWEGHT
jgi:hypothetical protein